MLTIYRKKRKTGFNSLLIDPTSPLTYNLSLSKYILTKGVDVPNHESVEILLKERSLFMDGRVAVEIRVIISGAVNLRIGGIFNTSLRDEIKSSEKNSILN